MPVLHGDDAEADMKTATPFTLPISPFLLAGRGGGPVSCRGPGRLQGEIARLIRRRASS